MSARVIALAVMVSCPGCGYAGYLAYFIRDVQQPVAALEVRMDPEVRRECLIVFLPGLMDTADAFLEHGFMGDAARASDRCDLVAADVHLAYYTTGVVRERVGEDILRVAHARGYREIWLVGVSMGGLGALLVAQANPSLVDGVILVAPWLGDARVVASVSRAGGIASWDPPPIDDPRADDQYTAALWAWLKGYVDSPEERPDLYVLVGAGDRLAATSRMLARALPPDRFVVARGGHQWSTWRVLWRRLLAAPPWVGWRGFSSPSPHRSESDGAPLPSSEPYGAPHLRARSHRGAMGPCRPTASLRDAWSPARSRAHGEPGSAVSRGGGSTSH